jgi:hypothetical protein
MLHHQPQNRFVTCWLAAVYCVFLLLSYEVLEHFEQFDELASFFCFEANQWLDTCHDGDDLTHVMITMA